MTLCTVTRVRPGGKVLSKQEKEDNKGGAVRGKERKGQQSKGGGKKAHRGFKSVPSFATDMSVALASGVNLLRVSGPQCFHSIQHMSPSVFMCKDMGL